MLPIVFVSLPCIIYLFYLHRLHLPANCDAFSPLCVPFFLDDKIADENKCLHAQVPAGCDAFNPKRSWGESDIIALQQARIH